MKINIKDQTIECAKCAARGKPINKLQGQTDGQKQRFIIA